MVIKTNLDKNSMDDKIDVTLFVISIQYLHKHNNNRINVIKSLKKKIKTLF